MGFILYRLLSYGAGGSGWALNVISGALAPLVARLFA
jgi:hypothetical protein